MEIYSIRNREETVRLIDNGHSELVPAYKALEIAEERGLDLIKINESNGVSNIKIGDYAKIIFDERKKEKQRIKKQNENKLNFKEIRITAGTSEHDIETKAKQIDKFIKHGDAVIITVVFKGRAVKFLNNGYNKLDEVTEKLTEEYIVKTEKHTENNKVKMIIAPKK